MLTRYLGVADQLKQAIVVMLEKHAITCDLMHGFNWDQWTPCKPTERLALIPTRQEHILEQEIRLGCLGAWVPDAYRV